MSAADATHTINYEDADFAPLDTSWLAAFFGGSVALRDDSILAGHNDIELASGGLTFGFHDGTKQTLIQVNNHGANQCSIVQKNMDAQVTTLIGTRIPTWVRANFLTTAGREAALFAFKATGAATLGGSACGPARPIGLWVK